MPPRLTPKEAQELMARLRDPLLPPLPVSEETGKTRSTSHRAPKVARRVSTGPGPEGRGRVHRGAAGEAVAVDLELDLLPVPKERPRVVRTKTGKIMSYTPPRTKRFTADVRAVLDTVMGREPPLEGPVSLLMEFRMAIPDGWPLWKKEAAREGRIAPTGRPDMDNLEKALLDALNGRAFLDDAYVVERLAVKRYGERPGMGMRIARLPAAALSARRAEVSQQLGLPPFSPFSYKEFQA